jgi:DNA-binding transcriptional MerR regulator
MTYTIKEIADLAGVTTRTIRYYDQIGLLPPAQIGENGYRYYNADSLLQLQQILFFRELDVPLKEIEMILTRPDFNVLAALEAHQQALETRVERMLTLIETIEHTITALKGEREMTDKDYFEGFDESQYEEEARERWGDDPKYSESMKRWGRYSDAQKQEIKLEGGRITVRMVSENPDAQPNDPDVQAVVGDYFAYLNKYFYPCDVEFLRCLSDGWVADPRFAANYERIREGGAKFVHEAVQIYCRYVA